MSSQVETVRLAGVELSPVGIKPAVGNLATLTKADDVKQVIVRYGFRSHHPIIQLIVGAALASLLPLAAIQVYHWIHGAYLFWGFYFVPVLGVIGFWMLLDAPSRGYYLLIRSTRGSRKVSFDKGVLPEQLKAFCQQLRQRKYQVVIDAPL